MPVVKNLKKLQKKKSDSKLHPNGRKFKQLSTAELRQAKLSHQKSLREERHGKKLERHLFLQALVRRVDRPVFTAEDLRTACEEFVERNSGEIDALEQSRRAGRPRTSRHEQLLQQRDAEREELRTGFLAVDLTDPATVERLREWEGSWGGLNTLKMLRCSCSAQSP